jgi:hypothetical protein
MKVLLTEIRKVDEVGEVLLPEQRLVEDAIRRWSSLGLALVQTGEVDQRLEADILAEYEGVTRRIEALAALSRSMAESLRARREALIGALQAVRSVPPDSPAERESESRPPES